ncbi:MAG: HD domain-containing protein [Candidatus Hermodarchaeota archaeon]
MKKFSRYWEALTFAAQNHGLTLRKDEKTPYIVHPLRITAILRAAGFSEYEHEDLMIAALFHDLVEDTNVSIKEITNKFGTKVSSIVEELSKPKQGNKDEWLKTFDKYSKEAQIIKMADRIDNLMDMKIESWSNEKKKSYAEQAKNILFKCRNANSDLAFELEKVIAYTLKSI